MMAFVLYDEHTSSIGRNYSGPAEKCICTFSTGPEQTDYVDGWLKNSLVSEAIAKVREQGGEVLHLACYRDISPTWKTNWRVEITAMFPTSDKVGVLVGGPWAIIIAALFVAVIAYFLIKPVIQSVTELLWGPQDNALAKMGIPMGAVLICGGVLLVLLLTKD